MEFNYQVETGLDGIRWVSIEPLMNDIVKSIEALMLLPTDTLEQKDKEILDLKIPGLRTVHEFLGSIITADNLKKMKSNVTEVVEPTESKKTLH